MSRGGRSEVVPYCLPHLTRASTAAETADLLPTPWDETNSCRPSKTAIVGPRNMHSLQNYGAHIRSGTLDNVLLDDSERYYSPLHDAEVQAQVDSYFSLPTERGDKRPGLRHRPSTKLLIDRYESMSSESNSSSGRGTPVSKSSGRAPPTSALRKDKGSSPIRRSFRNFLSVFKKAKSPEPDHSRILSTRYPSDAVIHEETKITSSSGNYGQYLELHKLPDDTVCISPLDMPLFSGPLLYLSRTAAPNSGSPMLPVWTSCSAALHSKHILLTSLSTQGNPSTLLVPLIDCADVRSLTLDQIDVNERALLPLKGDGEELKVFELQLEGKPSEKFAATSVQARAGWINSIWNTILQSSERLKTPLPEPHRPLKSLTIRTDIKPDTPRERTISPHQPTVIPQSIHSANTPSSVNSPCYSERELPPTPTSNSIKSPSVNPSLKGVALYDPHVSSKPSSPTVSSIRETLSRPSSPSRSKSPSIVNLGHRSVVRQRLAQIEQTYSDTPSPTRTTFSPSPLSRRPSEISARGSSPYSKRSAFQEIEKLQRHNTGSISSGKLVKEEQNSMLAVQSGTRSPSLTVSQRGHGNSEAHTPMLLGSGCHKTAENKEVTPHTGSSTFNDPFKSEDLRGATVDSSHEPVLGTQHVFGALEVIAEAIDSLTHKSDDAAHNLRHIRETLEISPKAGELDVKVALQELQRQLSIKLSLIVDGVTDLRSYSQSSQASTMMNLKPPAEHSGHNGNGSESSPQISDILKKLDVLTSLRGSQPMTEADIMGARENLKVDSSQINEVLDLLKNQDAQRVNQIEQQADSVRYLNELNTWLETFVKSGTSQIQTVANDVRNLCKEFGCGGQNQEANGEGDDTEGISLPTAIHQLLTETKDKEKNLMEIQASVERLFTVTNAFIDQQGSANTLTPESFIAVIERQRQEQQQMLKTIASELSQDIRGERLRFVDAMKEATAINVQAHVEQFKNELTREVMLMTQEVGRLHRERQVMEQQIAELFAFYSRQKQAGNATQAQTPASYLQVPVVGVRSQQAPPAGSHRPRTPGRPLPDPAPRR